MGHRRIRLNEAILNNESENQANYRNYYSTKYICLIYVILPVIWFFRGSGDVKHILAVMMAFR
jgi:hypothetical protein